MLFTAMTISSHSQAQKDVCKPKAGNQIRAELKRLNDDDVTKLIESRGQIWINWKELIQPKGCYIHFDEITMFYGRQKDLDPLPCCEGFKNVTSNPRKDTEPWLISDLCRDGPPEGKSQVYLKFKVGKQVKQDKSFLKAIPPCTFPQKVRNISHRYWPVLIAVGIFGIVLLVCMVALCCHYAKAKPKKSPPPYQHDDYVEPYQHDEYVEPYRAPEDHHRHHHHSHQDHRRSPSSSGSSKDYRRHHPQRIYPSESRSQSRFDDSGSKRYEDEQSHNDYYKEDSYY